MKQNESTHGACNIFRSKCHLPNVLTKFVDRDLEHPVYFDDIRRNRTLISSYVEMRREEGKKKKNICLYVKRTNCHDNVTFMQFLQIKKPTFGYVGLFGADLWFGLLWEFGNSRMVVSLRYIRGGFPKSFGTMKTRNGRTARVKYPQGRRTM